jgi:hypothetical protein
VIDLNAALLSAGYDSGRRLHFDYSSDSRAIARFDHAPTRVEIAGAAIPVQCPPAGECAVLLPRGKHTVVVQ